MAWLTWVMIVLLLLYFGGYSCYRYHSSISLSKSSLLSSLIFIEQKHAHLRSLILIDISSTIIKATVDKAKEKVKSCPCFKIKIKFVFLEFDSNFAFNFLLVFLKILKVLYVTFFSFLSHLLLHGFISASFK